MSKTPASMAAKIEKAHEHLNLSMHFDAAFTKILDDNAHRPRADVTAALAEYAVNWVEGFDAMLDG